MKKIITIVIAVMLLSVMFVFPVSAAGNGSIAMSSASGKQGDTVTLNVTMPSNPGLVTMTIRVTYDTNVLQLTNVSDPGLLVGAQLNTSYGSPYTISWVDGAATANNTKTGTIASFTFKIKDSATVGQTTVSLQFVDSYDTDYNENHFAASSGTITVNCRAHSYGGYTSSGDTQHSRTCSACGYTEKADHTWNSGTVTKQPSCKEAGEKEFTCSTCNATKTEPIAKLTTHSYSSWTKVNDTTHKRTCSVCQNTETAHHSWNSGTVTKKATCKEEGVKTYTCTGCSASKTETIAKLTTHTYDNACDPDCNVCGTKRSITHSYKSTWSKDKTQHWHECSVCKDKKDAAAHTPGTEATETRAQTCTTCGYIIKPVLGHKHSYATTWTTDDVGHWYACTGCEEKGSFAEHDFENACDPDCSVCGYTREVAHTYGEAWESNETNHWHACIGCGLKTEEAAHEPGAEATATTAQICTICGYEIVPALGGETTEPTDSITPDGDGASTEKNLTMPIVVAAVSAVVVGAGATSFVVIKKKKGHTSVH